MRQQWTHSRNKQPIKQRKNLNAHYWRWLHTISDYLPLLLRSRFFGLFLYSVHKRNLCCALISFEKRNFKKDNDFSALCSNSISVWEAVWRWDLLSGKEVIASPEASLCSSSPSGLQGGDCWWPEVSMRYQSGQRKRNARLVWFIQRYNEQEGDAN